MAMLMLMLTMVAFFDDVVVGVGVGGVDGVGVAAGVVVVVGGGFVVVAGVVVVVVSVLGVGVVLSCV